MEHAEALLTLALRCVQESPLLRPSLAEEIAPRLAWLAEEATAIGCEHLEVRNAAQLLDP